MAKLNDVLGRSDVPFLTSVQKHGLLDQGTPFNIIKIQANPGGKFGAEHRLTILVKGWEDYAILSMKDNPAREAMFASMTAFLSDGLETVGPVRLVTATSKAGNDFVTLEDVEEPAVEPLGPGDEDEGEAF